MFHYYTFSVLHVLRLAFDFPERFSEQYRSWNDKIELGKENFERLKIWKNGGEGGWVGEAEVVKLFNFVVGMCQIKNLM